jgi:hypothetical protein
MMFWFSLLMIASLLIDDNTLVSETIMMFWFSLLMIASLFIDAMLFRKRWLRLQEHHRLHNHNPVYHRESGNRNKRNKINPKLR